LAGVVWFGLPGLTADRAIYVEAGDEERAGWLSGLTPVDIRPANAWATKSCDSNGSLTQEPKVLEIDDRKPADTPLPRAFGVREVAKIFGRSPRTVRWWVQTGRLNTFAIGRSKYVSEAEIQRLIAGGED
jgi:hypothetical protein